MRQKTDLQKLFVKYGELTCLALVNLSYKKRFYSSMATARSELSAKQLEILIKKSLNYVKKLDLEERIYKSYKSGSFNVYLSLETAIGELGEMVILDMINQNLRYRMDTGESLFSISSLGEMELEILKKDYDTKVYNDFWAGKRSRGKGKKTLEKERSSRPTTLESFINQGRSDLREGINKGIDDREKKLIEESRKTMQEQQILELERKRETSNQNLQKRSLSDYDPNADQPEVIQLESLDERKLKNLEIQHEDSKKDENFK
jgi:hypothetical protein